MLKTHYSASEIIGLKLPCVPATVQGITIKAKNESWPSSKRVGRGGGKEYALAGMPQEVQTAIREREAKQALALLPKPQLPAVIEHVRASDTEHQRLIADARKGVLAALEKLMQSHGIKLKPAARKLLALAAEEPAGQLARMLKLARDPRGKDDPNALPHVCWFQRLVDRAETDTLSPRMPQADMSVPPWAPVFLSYWQTPEKRSVDHAYRMCAKAWDASTGALPSIYQVRRFIEKMGTVARSRGRMLDVEHKSQKAFKRRNFNKILPTQIYTADGHKFDAEVRHPKHGRPFRPEVTSIVDIATRRVVGWSVDLAESALAVLDAIRVAVVFGGVPSIFYVDNGSGYKNALMSDPATGLMARLGTDLSHSQPYSSQSRGVIERLHKTLWVTAAKELPGYIGADMDRQAKNQMFKKSRNALKKTSEKSKMPLLSWDEFMRFSLAKIDEYNARPHRSLPRITDPITGKVRHRSPNEQWQWFIDQGFEPEVLTNEQAQPLFRPRTLRTVQRAEITLHNKRYFSDALEEMNGAQVQVGFDVHDPERVWVYDDKGSLLCVAVLDGNATPYKPKSYIEQADEKRALGRASRAQAHLEEIDLELNNGRIKQAETMKIGMRIVTREELEAVHVEPKRDPEPLQLYAPAQKDEPELPAPTGWQVPETMEERYAEHERLCALPENEVPEEARHWVAGYLDTSEYRGLSLLKKSAHTLIRKSA